MQIDIITIFPSMFKAVLEASVLRIAQEKGLLKLKIHDLRNFTHNKHRQVDDVPYGGGPGMVMKPEPFFEAVESILGSRPEKIKDKARIILLTPQGEKLSQAKADKLAKEQGLVILCGHYEGVDERVREYLVTDEISIGDYVLTGGELPAMVLIETITRLIPGVLGNELSSKRDSFSQGLLEHPHYTRPAVYRGWSVPKVLLSGNHQTIKKWRHKETLIRTQKRRPDLIAKANLTSEDKELLGQLGGEDKA